MEKERAQAEAEQFRASGSEITTYRPDDPRLNRETAFKVTEKVIEKFRAILSELSDYAVISSTALYLLNKKGGKKSERPPGDFDAAVFSEATFKEVIERLVRAGAVFKELDKATVIENSSPIRAMPDIEAEVVAGYLPVEVDGQAIQYDFEFFYKSQVVPQELVGKTVDISGLKVLKVEALQRQYQENLRIESQVKEGVEKIAVFLNNVREQLQDPEYLKKVSEALSLSEKEIVEFFVLMDKRSPDDSQETRKSDHDQMVSLLSGGFKEKVFDRLEKIFRLRAMSAIELAEEEEKRLEKAA